MVSLSGASCVVCSQVGGVPQDKHAVSVGRGRIFESNIFCNGCKFCQIQVFKLAYSIKYKPLQINYNLLFLNKFSMDILNPPSGLPKIAS